MNKPTIPDSVAKMTVGSQITYEHIDAWGVDVGAHGVITVEQAESYAKNLSDYNLYEKLEQAAQICDRFASRDMHPAECAAAIRAMIPPKFRKDSPES